MLIDCQMYPVDPQNDCELEWLYEFIHEHHSSPRHLLPSREALKAPDMSYFWFKKGSEVVGIGGFKEISPKLAELKYTILHPSYRGKKLGRRLSDEVLDYLEMAGFHKVISHVYVSNLSQIIIKHKQGFICEALFKDHDQPGLHEYVFSKILEVK